MMGPIVLFAGGSVTLAHEQSVPKAHIPSALMGVCLGFAGAHTCTHQILPPQFRALRSQSGGLRYALEAPISAYF